MTETSVATTDLPLDTLAATIKARIEAGDRSAEKAADHYRAAGLHLVEAKTRLAQTGGKFDHFLVECGIGRSRAYELIGIAKGTKTLAGIRAATCERVARHADRNRTARESVTSGQHPPDHDSALVPEVEWLRAELGRLQAEIERLTEENTALKDRVEVSVLEITCLRAENARLRDDEESEPDWPIVSDSEQSADEILHEAFRIGLNEYLAYRIFENEPEANAAQLRLTEVDIRGAGDFLGVLTAKRIARKIGVRKKADRQPPDKAALAALRKRAQALGYKTIHRRGDTYWLVNADGESTTGTTGGLDAVASFLDDEEAFQAGAVRVISTACGMPVSACDRNGPVELDDPRAVEAFARLAA